MNNKITKIDVRNFELEMCIWIGKYPKKTLKVHEKYIFFPLQLFYFGILKTYSLKKKKKKSPVILR